MSFSQCNLKRNAGALGEGNEIIAGQYSVMGWDLVKVNVSWISIPETMVETKRENVFVAFV